MQPLSRYLAVMLASTMDSQSSLKEVVTGFKAIYQEIEDISPVSKSYSTSIKFSFVKPEGAVGGIEYDPSRDSPFDYVAKEYSNQKPLAIYFPGLDCVGISARAQFADLSNTFELWRMSATTDDRSSFRTLTKLATDFVIDLTKSTNRDVILIGESFGGLVAPVVALKLQAKAKKDGSQNPVRGLVMVNPATSWNATNWDQLGPALANLRFLQGDNAGSVNPYTLLGGLTLSALIPDSTQLNRIVELILGAQPQSLSVSEALELLSDGFGILGKRLPPALIKHRVGNWLPIGAALLTDERLAGLEMATLILVGDDDKFLPSKGEADRLQQIIPSSKKINVKGSGHYVLDSRVNLTEAIVFSDIDPLYLKDQKKRDRILDWELPPLDQVQNIINNRVQPLRRLTSPRFFSTDEAGRRWTGLGKIPAEGPIVFIANHQFRK